MGKMSFQSEAARCFECKFWGGRDTFSAVVMAWINAVRQIMETGRPNFFTLSFQLCGTLNVIKLYFFSGKNYLHVCDTCTKMCHGMYIRFCRGVCNITTKQICTYFFFFFFFLYPRKNVNTSVSQFRTWTY